MCGTFLRLLTCILVGLLSCILVAFKDDFNRKLLVFINVLLKEKFWNRGLRWVPHLKSEISSSSKSFSLFFCSSIQELLNGDSRNKFSLLSIAIVRGSKRNQVLIVKLRILPVSGYSFPLIFQINLFDISV